MLWTNRLSKHEAKGAARKLSFLNNNNDIQIMHYQKMLSQCCSSCWGCWAIKNWTWSSNSIGGKVDIIHLAGTRFGNQRKLQHGNGMCLMQMKCEMLVSDRFGALRAAHLLKCLFTLCGE